MIAKNLDCEMYGSPNYKLIVEDSIQKKFSNIDLPSVSFSYQTQFSYLVDYYKRENIEFSKESCSIPCKLS